MDVRIVLLPDNQTHGSVIRSSSMVWNKLPSLFVLNKANIPHITLLHVQFPNKHFQRICDKVERIVRNQHIISVVTNAVMSGTESKTFIGLYFQNDQEIIHLRERIYEKIQALIDKIASFKKPHLTLTRLKHDADVEKALELKSNFTGEKQRYTKVAICETGQNGVCTRILYSVPLKLHLRGGLR